MSNSRIAYISSALLYVLAKLVFLKETFMLFMDLEQTSALRFSPLWVKFHTELKVLPILQKILQIHDLGITVGLGLPLLKGLYINPENNNNIKK